MARALLPASSMVRRFVVALCVALPIAACAARPHLAPTCAGQSACSAACDSGDACACNRLAHVFLAGEEAPRDRRRAHELQTRACEAGCSFGCYGVGVDAELAGSADAAGFFRRAALGFERECAAGDGDACSALSDARLCRRASIDPLRAPEYGAKAIAIFRSLCEDGVARGCVKLGAAYFLGDGVPKDEALAAALDDKACTLGDTGGCVSAARHARKWLREGERTIEGERALRSFQKGCDADDVYACEDAARMLARGRGVARDPAAAQPFAERMLRLLERRCDFGEPSSCGYAASLLKNDPDMAVPDPAFWAENLEKKQMALDATACDAGDASACYGLAGFYERWAHGPVPPDPDRARALRKRACDLGMRDACK